jgi:RNA polymerase sigma-70 factor (ECF subfamily)
MLAAGFSSLTARPRKRLRRVSFALSTTDGPELFAGLSGPPSAARRVAAASSPSPASHEIRLARAARGGDRHAFAELYELFAPTVHGILLATARREEVADLVQEVFLLALRSIEQLDAPERFAAWLSTIARNCARDTHRAGHRAQELTPELEGAAKSGFARDVDELEEATRILAFVCDLPDAYRETLTLRLVEGLTGPEIAERTGMTAGSVRVNLCRGMKLLRERLEGGGRP